jgi:hypothetical protein
MKTSEAATATSGRIDSSPIGGDDDGKHKKKKTESMQDLTQNSAFSPTKRDLSVFLGRTSTKGPNGAINAAPAPDGFFRNIASQTASTRRVTSRQTTSQPKLIQYESLD